MHILIVTCIVIYLIVYFFKHFDRRKKTTTVKLYTLWVYASIGMMVLLFIAFIIHIYKL
jgi:FtsH-binding integral membrane protein